MGAFGVWKSQNSDFTHEKALEQGGKLGKAGFMKMAGELWRQMSEEEKAPWQRMYEENWQAFAEFKKSDSYTPPVPVRKRSGKRAKPTHDTVVTPVLDHRIETEKTAAGAKCVARSEAEENVAQKKLDLQFDLQVETEDEEKDDVITVKRRAVATPQGAPSARRPRRNDSGVLSMCRS